MQFLSFRRLLRRKPQAGDVVMVKGGGPLRLRAITKLSKENKSWTLGWRPLLPK